MDKQRTVECFAPVSGKTVELDKVNDRVFSERIMGDGLAILPEEDVICSPVKGKIKMLFHTGHAFVIETEEGFNIMVHIGIDTVKREGEGFLKLLSQEDKVEVGTPVIKLDYSKLEGVDMTTMVIAMNDNECLKVDKTRRKECEAAKTSLMRVMKG